MFPELMEALADQSLAVAMLIAVGAGFVSTGVCPCTLPLGAGVAAAAGGTEAGQRRAGLALVGAVGLGLVVTIGLLGAVAGHAGALLTLSFGRYWALTMALFTFAAAIIAFAGVRLKAPQLEKLRRPGMAGGFLYGAVYSLGTATAPLLALLAAAAVQAQPGHGAALGVTFGIGRALPLVLIGLSAGFLSRFLQSPRRRQILQTVSGCVLLAASFYFGWVFAGFF